MLSMMPLEYPLWLQATVPEATGAKNRAVVFDLSGAVLYERRTEVFYRAEPSGFEGLAKHIFPTRSAIA
jgi:hypothetical protein